VEKTEKASDERTEAIVELLLRKKDEQPIWERFSFEKSSTEPEGYVLAIASASLDTGPRR
jgi:hypothetical protein